MVKLSRFYGKLTKECLEGMDRLLLAMKAINKENLKRRVIRRSEIVMLPEGEYLQLWGWLRHCCVLVASWPNISEAISTIAKKREMAFDEVKDEAVDSMTIHCITYAWRKYEHSEDCGYVLSTAMFGWQSWIEEQNSYHDGIAEMIGEEEQRRPSCGHKVSNLNMAK